MSEETKNVVVEKKVKEVKPRVSNEFKVIGIFSDDELVGVSTSEASKLSKLVTLGDKEAKDHEIVEFVQSEEIMTEAYKTQSKVIKSATAKIEKLELEIDALENAEEKDPAKTEEKLAKLKTELENEIERLDGAEEIQALVNGSEYESSIYVMHFIEEGVVGEVFFKEKAVVNKKTGKERMKKSYFVYETSKQANNGLRLKLKEGLPVCIVEYKEA